MGKSARIRARRARQVAAASEHLGLRPSGFPALPDLKPGDEISLFWLAVRHTCGHALDWGIDTQKYPDFADRLGAFITAASADPCPRCGSGAGVPHDLPISDEPTYLVAHDLWYRVCGADQQADATRNAELAALRRDVR